MFLKIFFIDSTSVLFLGLSLLKLSKIRGLDVLRNDNNIIGGNCFGNNNNNYNSGNSVGYGCARCGKHYKRKETLSRHVRLECGTVPKFKCDYCMYRFKRREHLVAHLRSKHSVYLM